MGRTTKWTLAIVGVGAGAMTALFVWEVLRGPVSVTFSEAVFGFAWVLGGMLFPWIILGISALAFRLRRWAAGVLFVGAALISTVGPSGYFQMVLRESEFQEETYGWAVFALIAYLWFAAILTALVAAILALLDSAGIFPRLKRRPVSPVNIEGDRSDGIGTNKGSR